MKTKRTSQKNSKKTRMITSPSLKARCLSLMAC